MVICLERGADLHMVQLMPLPLTVSCFSKIQVGFTFLVGLTRVVPEKGPLNGCVCVLLLYIFFTCRFHISQVEVVAGTFPSCARRTPLDGSVSGAVTHQRPARASMFSRVKQRH